MRCCARRPDLAFAPLREGEVLPPEEYQKLPQDEQERIQQEVEALQGELQQVLLQVPRWEREFRSRMHDLQQEVTEFVLSDLMKELYEKYEKLDDVIEYLHAVQDDVGDNLGELLQADGEAQEGAGAPPEGPRTPPAMRRYQVNVLVDAGDAKGAPVVYENNPSYLGLVGRVEQMAMMGALVTDFTLIKPGALHQANGGYLMLDALKVLTNPNAWEGLKRALQYGEIRIESPLQMMSLTSTISLEPEPAKLDTKVILMGDRQIYYLLAQADPEFNDLFKVAADFDDEFTRDEETTILYAQLIARMVHKEDLLPFERRAVCRVIEFASREVSDAERVTARMQNVVDLLKEADYWARAAGRGTCGRSARGTGHRGESLPLGSRAAASAGGNAARDDSGRHGRRSGGPDQRAVGHATGQRRVWQALANHGERTHGARRSRGHRTRGGIKRPAAFQGGVDPVQFLDGEIHA